MSLRNVLVVTLVAGLCVATGGVAQAALTVAGNLLVNLDAQALPAGTLNTWANAGSLGGTFDFHNDAELNGGDISVVDIGGVTAVDWTDTDNDDDRMVSSVLAPAGITGGSDWSLEIWMYQEPGAWWEDTMVSWAGRNHGGGGGTAHFDCGGNAVVHWGMDINGFQPPDDAWTHVTYTYGGSAGEGGNREEKLYYDGVLQTTVTWDLNIFSGDEIALGDVEEGQDNWVRRFIGSMAQVRIHDGLLSDADVLNNFQAGITARLLLGPLTSISSGNWNAVSTWDDGVAVPTADYATVVDGETVNVVAPGEAGSLTVSAGQVVVNGGQSLTVGDVELTGGLLTVNTTGTLAAGKLNTNGLGVVAGSILNISKKLTVDSNIDLTGVVLDVSTATVVVPTGGTLTHSGNFSVGSLDLAGGAVDLDGNDLTVANTLTITGLFDTADPSFGSLDVATATVVLDGGTLTLDEAVTADTLVFANGGTYAGTHVVTPTTEYRVLDTTVALDLAAPTADLIAAKGTVELTGTNTYGGKTVVTNGAVLKVADLDTNVGVGNVELNNGYLAGSTIQRKIGTEDGQISFSGDFGFTADGADTTVTLTRNDEADSPLDWNDPLNGFGGNTLMVDNLGSHTVEITNDINLEGGRTFNFGGPRGTADVGLILSGNLSGGSIRVDEHRNGADYGVFWLAGSDNSGITSMRQRTAGIVRYVDQETGLTNLPAEPAFGEIYYSQIETNGTFQLRGNQDLGNTTPGYICLNWGGGFSAYGDDLTIHLIGATEADPFLLGEHAYPSGFGEMYLNSPYSDGVVTIKGDFVSGTQDFYDNWPIRIFNNPDTDADYARLESNWSMEGMRIGGNNNGGGIVKLVEGYTITTDSSQGPAGEFTIQNSAVFRANGTLDVTGGGNVIVTSTGRLGGNGTVILGGNRVEVQGNSGVAPGDGVGELTIEGGLLQMLANSNYDWEIGQPLDLITADMVAITGDLELGGNISLNILDGDGFIADFTDQRDVFSYTGNLLGTLGNLVPDLTGLPVGWEEGDGGVQILTEDRQGVHYIYLTNLRGGVPTFMTWEGGVGNWNSDVDWEPDGPTTSQSSCVVQDPGDYVSVTDAQLAGYLAVDSGVVGIENGGTLSVTRTAATAPDGVLDVGAGAALSAATVENAGTLNVDGTLTAAMVTSHGTLSGTGRIVGEVWADGIVAPGSTAKSGIGPLTFDTGDPTEKWVEFGPAAEVNMDIGVTNDVIVMQKGVLDLGGSQLNLNVVGDILPAAAKRPYGAKTVNIVDTTENSEIDDVFNTALLPGDHLDRGIFLDVEGNGVVTTTISVKVDLYQAQKGDANGDHVIDTGDMMLVFGNWSLLPPPDNVPRDWPEGNFSFFPPEDANTTIETGDMMEVFGNWTLKDAGDAKDGDPQIADLLYYPATGEVELDPSEAAGEVITIFRLMNDPGEPDFNAPGEANFPWPLPDFLAVDTPLEIANTDLSGSGISDVWSLGAIFPTGLDQDQLEAFLTVATYVGSRGTGVHRLDLIVIPEPGTVVMLLTGALGLLLLALRRRRMA